MVGCESNYLYMNNTPIYSTTMGRQINPHVPTMANLQKYNSILLFYFN
uniref:Uncharacterized protein n=1 Tax=Anguilla anguilla TaxID=7936 RepID=A0A0E9TRY4_ANGAN